MFCVQTAEKRIMSNSKPLLKILIIIIYIYIQLVNVECDKSVSDSLVGFHNKQRLVISTLSKSHPININSHILIITLFKKARI